MVTTKKIYSVFEQVGSVSTDTRTITDGSIFFALKGDRFDANKFVLQATELGAQLVVADNLTAIKSELDTAQKKQVDKLIKEEVIIIVDDSLVALQKLAQYHRNMLGTQIIAITGSNGKTTTKELTARVLAKKFNISVTEGNLNNHIGVPLTLLKITEDTDIAIVEMGASHPKEIELLASIARPDYGLITNIGKAHLEGFGSQEGVRKGKGELADYLEANHGMLFYLSDSDLLQRIADEHPALTSIAYSTSKWTPIKAQFAQAEFLETKYQSNLTGDYNIINMAAAQAVGKFFGIADSDIAAAIASYEPQNNRSQKMTTDSNTIICDAYNANPSSMNSALDAFMSLENQHQQRIVILGDMLELGKHSSAEHKIVSDKVAQLISSNEISAAYLVGSQWNKEQGCDKMFFFDNSEQLVREFETNKISDSLILVKGSHSIALEKVFEQL